VIWLGTHQQLNKVTAHVLTLPNATVQLSTAINDLGVLLDSSPWPTMWLHFADPVIIIIIIIIIINI